MRTTILILFASLLLLTSCNNTTDPVEKDQQLTKEQADQLYAGNQYILVQAVNFISLQSKIAAQGNVIDLPVGFGGNFALKPAMKKSPVNVV